MYESPISLVEQIADEVRVETERTLVEYVRKIGFNVDKCELERALLYDRRQYEKGYNEGYQDGRASAASWVPCAIGLPEPDVRVLCLTQTKAGRTNYVIGYHDGQRWCCGMNSNVIYWQWLPEAPKEE